MLEEAVRATENVEKERAYRVFNQSGRFAQGWYWVMRSHHLRPNKVQTTQLLGRALILSRNSGKEVVIKDHQWPHDENSESYPVAERYGLIWVWIGKDAAAQGQVPGQAPGPLPHVPELGDQDCEAVLSDRFARQCHPNVLLINAIDAHHFNSVHNLPLEIRYEMCALSERALQFNNVTRGGEASRFVRLIRPLYKNEVTYRLCYWYGNTGTVTLGPDFLHFYLMFALRPAERDGKKGSTEGQMILLTPKRKGLFGWLFNRIVLFITQLVAAYFAKGDRHVFDSIKFNFKVPLAADRSIVQFIQHVEAQPALSWKDWT